jgi:DNA-binding FadR family transcriptional regulator
VRSCKPAARLSRSGGLASAADQIEMLLAERRFFNRELMNEMVKPHTESRLAKLAEILLCEQKSNIAIANWLLGPGDGGGQSVKSVAKA